MSPDEMEACKNSFNTWAYIGDINDKPQASDNEGRPTHRTWFDHHLTPRAPSPPFPQVNCVYQSDDAQNEFLSNPKIGLGEDVYDKVNKTPYDPAADDL